MSVYPVILNSDISDMPEILELQKKAFYPEAALNGDMNIPPMTQTLREIQDEAAGKIFLKALVNNKIAGSVRASSDGHTCFIGRLIVDPELQNQGIGTALMHAVEKHFPAIARFELFTGKSSVGNIRFYQKLGYRIFRETQSGNVTLVFLEK